MSDPVCPAPSCVEMYDAEGRTPCTATCPADDGGALGGRIDNGRWVERTYNRGRCMSRVYNYWGPAFQKILAETLDEPDSGKRRMLINSTMFTRTLWSMTYANISQGQCFECMRVCPVDHQCRQLR